MYLVTYFYTKSCNNNLFFHCIIYYNIIIDILKSSSSFLDSFE